MAGTTVMRLNSTCFPLFRMVPTGEGRAAVQQLDRAEGWVDVYADDSAQRAFVEMNRMMRYHAGSAHVCAHCGGPVKESPYLSHGAAFCSELCMPTTREKGALFPLGWIMLTFMLSVALACWMVGSSRDAWELLLHLLGVR